MRRSSRPNQDQPHNSTMTRYKKDPEEFLSEVVKTILTENISELSAGGRFFAEMGVLVTDNIEDEYISPTPDMVFHSGDILWIVGDPKQLARLK